MGYQVHRKVLTTKDYNLPQSRPRVYIVGIRSDSVKAKFEWPKPEVATVRVQDLLDVGKSDGRKLQSELSDAMKSRLDDVLEQIRNKGGRPSKEFWFIDIDASEERTYWIKDTCPCLTKSRGSHGFYVTKLRGMMTLREVARFQGLDPAKLQMDTSGIGRTAWGQALGDGMSLNVLTRVLNNALFSAGLVGEVIWVV